MAAGYSRERSAGSTDGASLAGALHWNTFHMTLTGPEILSLLLACLGMLSSVGMLVMNLRVTSAMSELKSGFTVDLSKVELQIANLRADFAKEQAEMYRQVTTNLSTMYMNRKESEQMHLANSQRLDRIDSELRSLNERMPGAS